MSVVVFVGPTLSVKQVGREIDAVCLPPVAQGDVYEAVSKRPRAIGIIDGYFESIPAVWHKEILWALSQGVHVFGSASMGALRAAELAYFGMIGVGSIYRQFADGHLQDDDEVAVIHAPGDFGYRCLSEAMVSIRATLAAAQAAGVIGPALFQALLRIAKELHYPQRSYETILEQGRRQALSGTALRELEDWLPEGRVDQKREDALAMLREMREHLSGHPGPHCPSFEFEATRSWSRMAVAAPGDGPVSAEGPPTGQIRDFLRRILD